MAYYYCSEECGYSEYTDWDKRGLPCLHCGASLKKRPDSDDLLEDEVYYNV